MDKETSFLDLPPMDYKEQATQCSPQEFDKVVKSRRSVRDFTSEIVPEKIIKECLSMALLAPNSSNLQPWEFYWVRSPQKKQDLIRACFNQPTAKTAQELVVAVARIDTWKKHSQQMLEIFEKTDQKVPQAAINYYKKLAPFVYTMGPFSIFGWLKKVLYTVLGLFRPIVREPTSKQELKTWAIKSTALACQNFMLAIRSRGFDTCPMEGLDSLRVKKLLGLPRSSQIVMAISVGNRSPQGVYGPQIRFDEKQFIKEV